MVDASNPRGEAGFRKLRFESIEGVVAEVNRIVEAGRTGRLRATGNWTSGQILAHLAAWIEYAYDGFPMRPAPWLLRVILRLRLKKMLNKGMPRGIRIPGVKTGTFGQDDMPLEEAARRFQAALRRLAADPDAKHPSPAFGDLTHEERIKLNLRHAENHLGNLNY
jgi:Protein of unknown function (DUF1569)